MSLDDFGCESGAAEETRTPDPIITNDVLYHLSYSGDSPAHSTGAQAGKDLFFRLGVQHFGGVVTAGCPTIRGSISVPAGMATSPIAGVFQARLSNAWQLEQTGPQEAWIWLQLSQTHCGPRDWVNRDPHQIPSGPVPVGRRRVSRSRSSQTSRHIS